jgi:prepilin-type N-terminal cleavage/methylation domain-containing protein
MKRNRFHSQSGFTLVEIAIVLVIIGLLLGGVLKGQELIENAKVKSVINDFNGIKAAYYAYQDRYRRLPGDDGPAATFTARGGSWGGMTPGNTSGVIDAPAGQTFNPTAATEIHLFFRHLRAAGLITGNPADGAAAPFTAALPRNAYGGLIGIFNGGNFLGYNQAPLHVCAGNIPGKAAAAIDNQLDDGARATGNVRATVGANNFPPGAVTPGGYVETNTYTVCVTL